MITLEYAVARIGRSVRVTMNNGEDDVSGRLADVLGPWGVGLVIEPIPADGSTWFVHLAEIDRLRISG